MAVKWSDIASGTIAVVQEKTQTKVWIPVHRDLKPILDAIPKRSITVLTNQAGKPWTSNGFRASWRKDKANPEGLDVYFQEVVHTDHRILSIRSGPAKLMLQHVSDSPEDRMNMHKNARQTPKGREMMVRAVVDEGMTKAIVARQFRTTSKTVAKKDKHREIKGSSDRVRIEHSGKKRQTQRDKRQF